MWIFLGIILLIALLIAIFLLLPVHIIIKTDQNGEMIFRCKILFKTFGEESNPDSTVINNFKEMLGLTRLDKDKLKENAKKGSFLETVNESFTLIIGLLKRLFELLKFTKIKTLKVNIICAENDAAQTAIDYGRCYALVSPLLSFIHSSVKIKRRNENINITCNFETNQSYYDFEAVLVLPIFRILGALLRAARDESRRQATNNSN